MEGQGKRCAAASAPPALVLGALLPLLLTNLRVDAAHASTTIQVIMDVSGVLITCNVAPFVFSALTGAG